MYPIVHTEFVAEICSFLEITAYNCGWAKCGDADFHISQEMLFDNLKWALELLQADINRLNEEIAALDDDCDMSDYMELKHDIEADDRCASDLAILADLESADYANLNCIFLSIETLSEKLSAQLEAKADRTAYYNEYHCKRLAECLSELCELIKEV